MRIRLYCPVCERPGRVTLPTTSRWQCPACDHLLELAGGEGEGSSCAVCGNQELYRKKDFPHGLGMTVLVGAFIASTFTYWWYARWWTWAILLGSAAFDGILYLLVKDVVVCYRCHAEHRDLAHPERHPPFELAIHERYRQERLRREEMQNSGQ